jgi:fatty acid desaturase
MSSPFFPWRKVWIAAVAVAAIPLLIMVWSVPVLALEVALAVGAFVWLTLASVNAFNFLLAWLISDNRPQPSNKRGRSH